MGQNDLIKTILAEIATKEGCRAEEIRAEIDRALQMAFAAKTKENAALWAELGGEASCPDALEFIAAAAEKLTQQD